MNKLEFFFDATRKSWYTYDRFLIKNSLTSSVINYLDYYAIINSIPKEWKRLANLKGETNDKLLVDKLFTMTKISKFVYDLLVTRRGIKSTARTRWENKMQIEIIEDKWGKYMSTVYDVTNSVKLRWFQFRTLNLILTTNSDRAKWDKNVSPLCTFCEKEIETVRHLFCGCTIVIRKVWKPLKRWLDYFCYLPFDINPVEIIFFRLQR